MQGGFQINDVIGILRRRWWLLLLPLVIGAPAAVAVAMLLPSVYQSNARILVESQLIPDQLVRSTVEQSTAERIQLIRQRLFTRQNMLEIAREHGVFAGQPGLSQTEIVNLMQAGAQINGASSGGRRRGANVTGVEISFRYSDGVVAARVVNELVSRVLSQNVEQRTNRASGTLAFFEEQTTRLARALEAQAQRISDFKTANQGALPGAAAGLQNEMGALREKAFELTAGRARLDEDIARMERALARGETPLPVGGAATPQQAELARLRNTLVAQRAVLNDSHPTIRLLNARIAALQEAIDESAADAGAQDGAEGAADDGRSPLSLAEAELATLRQRRALIDEQIEANAARIDAITIAMAEAPEVEMQLASLQRTYETLQVQYREAVLKRSQAEIGERLETSQQAERFEVIEQAIAPERPIAPNRTKIMAAGVVASGALGVMLMLAAELLNRSLRTASGMARQLDALPIVTIPYIASAREQVVRRWSLRALFVGALTVPPLALYLVDTYYLPLPLVMQRLMERSGLGRFLEPVLALFGG